MLNRSLQHEYNKFSKKYIDSMYRIKLRKDSVTRVKNQKKLDSIKKTQAIPKAT